MKYFSIEWEEYNCNIWFWFFLFFRLGCNMEMSFFYVVFYVYELIDFY